MSAAPREPSGTIPYGSSPGGGGAGGKFRKNPYRRSHAATPYDRPPSSIRNLPGFLSDLGRESGTGNDGWLRRIVNPAQRLITAGAHKLFASVFQKRLTQPPLPQPPEKGQDAQKSQQEAVSTRPPREPEGPISVFQKATSTNDDSSFVHLEKILKQRTFSKSEIDRLTALLHGRPLNTSVANEVKKPEVFSSGPHDLKDGTSGIMRKDDDNENLLPVTLVKVLESDIASPAELAKAYMGTRASKAGPSDFREDSLLITSSQQTPKLPVMSLSPTSSNLRVHENGSITPRSRGRSAIYSMARTPYARAHQTTPLKILESMSERGDERSVAPQAPKTGRISGSNASKRRSSIFENDIGSVGPLRRIRHKPNLSYPRNNSLLSSTSVARHLAPFPSTDSSHKFTDQFVGNEGIAVPSRNMPSVSSKSSEIASKILEQLDKIVSPPKEKSSVVRLASLRDKAPMKLFPSDLHGRSLKTLDQIDSSKHLEIARGSSKLDDSAGTSHQDLGASALQQIDKVEQKGRSRAPFGFNELPPSGNHPEAATVERHIVLNEKVVVLDETIPVSASSASMNRTFRMSAHDDYVDLDDDDQYTKAASTLLVDDGDKLESRTIKPTLTTEADAKDEPEPVSEAHVPPFGLKERKSGESPFTANSSEKTVTFGFPSIPPTKKNVEPDVRAALSKPVSDSSTSKREPSVVPAVFAFGKEANSGNEERSAASAFVFVNNGPMTKDADKFNRSSTTNFAKQSSFSESSSSFSATAAGRVPAFTTATELNKVDDKKDPSPGVLETPTPAPLDASTTSSTTSFFKFGIPTGPAAAQPGFSLAAESSAPSPAKPVNNLPAVALSGSGGSDGKSNPQLALAFAHQLPPIFNFQSTTTMTTSTSSETPAVTPVEVQNKGDLGSVNTAGNPFSASSSANPSTVSSTFGFTAPASNGASSDKQGPISFGMSNGPSQVLASTSGSGLSSSTQTVPFQFGSSAASFSFGLAGNTNTSSGSSPVGSSAVVKFSTGTSLGITSSPSLESTVVSSSSDTTSNLFGSLQTTAAPVFGTSPSSISPLTGFSYGALSSTGPISFGDAASSSGSIFGSLGFSASSNGPSSLALSGSSTSSSVTRLFGSAASTSSPAPAFTFGASTAGNPSHPIFGNSNSVFSFGQTSTSNNGQMNAEDSMAEDTIPAATPPVSFFGQQQISPGPPSNFVFDSGANPFQFGGQQSFATPPNPSPFAASGSLDFNASGGSSFSLGTGGGDKSARKIVKVKHRQRRK